MKNRLLKGIFQFLLIVQVSALTAFGQAPPSYSKLTFSEGPVFKQLALDFKGENMLDNGLSEEQFKDFLHSVDREFTSDRNEYQDYVLYGQINQQEAVSYLENLKMKYQTLLDEYVRHSQHSHQHHTEKKIEGDHQHPFLRSGNRNPGQRGPGQPCNNMDFETGDFTGWDLYQGNVDNNPYGYVSVAGTAPGTQHTIQTAGTDAIVGIPTVNPDGGTFSVMLGDYTGTGGRAASLEQTFLVDSNNAVFTYSYALVLEDPSSHTLGEKPFFKVNVYDQNGNSIACGDYSVIAGPVNSGGDPDFVSYSGGYYLPWRTTFAPLDAYIGQNVTIQMIIGDCSQSGHYGYGYVDATCNPLEILTSSPVICGGQSIDLEAPSGAASYNWSSGQNSQIITVSTPGTYTVTVTPVTGAACSVNMSINVTGSPGIPTADFTLAPDPACIGDPVSFTDFSIPPGGESIISWDWDFGDASGTSTTQNPTYTYTSGGNFTVDLEVMTDAGCLDDVSFPITVNPFADPTINPAGPFCDDNGVVALTTVGSGGTWSGAADVSGNFDPSSGAGIYDVYYEVGTGNCINRDTLSITVEGVTLVSSTKTDVTCFGFNDGSITITAANADTYIIDNGTPVSQNNGNFTGLAPGVYNITVENNTLSPACTEQSTITVSEPQPLLLNFAVFDVTCFNACDGSAIVIPSGGNSPYNYSWTTGSTSASIQNTCAGNYVLTVVDQKFCQIDTAFSVIQPTDFVVQTSSVNSNCGQPDGSLSVDNVSGASPGASGYIYSWNPGGQNSAQVANVTDGNYIVTISDTAGCDTSLTVNVGFNPPPVANVSGTSTLCYGSCDGTATVNATGGTSGSSYIYTWSDGQSVTTATGLCVGAYNVTVSDLNGCIDSKNINIIQPTEVITSISNDSIICIGGTFQFSAVASGGTGSGYVYLWDNGSVGANPPGVSPVSPNCYTVSVTDANGCLASPVSVCTGVYPSLNVNALSNQSICEGNSVTLTSNANGGIGAPYTYTWTNSNGFLASGASISDAPSGSNPAVVTYMVLVNDNCETPPDTAYVDINFHVMPVADFTVDERSGCEPHDAIFTSLSSNSTSCIWSLGDGSIAQGCGNIAHTYPEVGSYHISLTVFSPEGCTDQMTRNSYITVFPDPVADFIFSPQPTTIVETEIEFWDMSLGSDISNWQWEFFSNQNNDVIGTTVAQNPKFDFSSEDYPFNLSANPNYPYNYFSQDTGTYPVTLTVTTLNGCVDEFTDYVKIDNIFRTNVPNAFTPNGDGINDVFFPKGVGIHPDEDYSFMIFNRWGDLIWSSESLKESWDGTAREMSGSGMVQEGVYVWRLLLKDVTPNPRNHEFMGHVVLLR